MGHLSQDDGKSEKQCHWCHSNVEIAFSSPMVGGEGGGSRSGHLRIIATAHVPAVLFIRQRPASRGYDSHFDHSILFGQMLCSRFVRLIKSHSVTWDICPRMMEKARSNATGVTQMWKLPSPPLSALRSVKFCENSLRSNLPRHHTA